MKKWIVLGLVSAISLAFSGTAGAQVDVFPGGTGDKDFCEAFNLLITNPLIDSLPAEFQGLVSELAPGVADINGTVIVDESGAEAVITIVGNGLLDANNELRLIERILADPGFDNGVLTHAQVLAAWNDNLDQMINGQFGAANHTLLNTLVPGLTEILVGYITLGDGSFTVDGDVTTAQGSFGFVAALFTLLGDALASLSITLNDPTIDAVDFTLLTVLTASQDADGDTFTNIQEYNAFTPDACSSKGGGELFPVAALDPLVFPSGTEGEGEGDSEVELSISGATLLENGDDIDLTVVGTGLTNPVSYQWRKNGADLPGRILPNLVINDICDGSVSCGGIDDGGVFDCVVNDGSSKAQFVSPAVQVRVFPVGGLPVSSGIGLGLLALVGLAGGTAAIRKRR